VSDDIQAALAPVEAAGSANTADAPNAFREPVATPHRMSPKLFGDRDGIREAAEELTN
jgi:hypothetical protein